MKRESQDIVSFKCKVPRLRHDISAGMSAFLTFYAYYYSYFSLRNMGQTKQLFILLLTYAGYNVILRLGFNLIYKFLYPHKVIISSDGAYIRGYGKQIEIIKHEGYKILGKTEGSGLSYVEDAVAVRLTIRNAKKLVFIDNGDGKAEEKLKSLKGK